MILLKTPLNRRPLREIITEWVLAFGLLTWGISITILPDLFKSHDFYSGLSSIAPQWIWATGTIITAVIRLIALSLDGRWRFSPHVRALTAALSNIMWGSLLTIAVLQVPFRAPSIAILGIPLTLEFLTLWWSAGDAKFEDQLANNSKKNG